MFVYSFLIQWKYCLQIINMSNLVKRYVTYNNISIKLYYCLIRIKIDQLESIKNIP